MMLDDSDDTNVLMMLMAIMISCHLPTMRMAILLPIMMLPMKTIPTQPTNKKKVKQSNKMPKEEGRFQPSSADSPTMVTNNMQHLMSRESNNIKINAQQQAQCIARISLVSAREKQTPSVSFWSTLPLKEKQQSRTRTVINKIHSSKQSVS